MQDEMNDLQMPYTDERPGDLIRVVRCKDCIKFAEVMEGTSPKCMRAFWLGGDMSPEDYCSRGVRKE